MTDEMFGATKKYDRFSKEEMLEQYRDLAFYIITELSSDDLESIQFSIADVKELTGYDVSLKRL